MPKSTKKAAASAVQRAFQVRIDPQIANGVRAVAKRRGMYIGRLVEAAFLRLIHEENTSAASK